MPAQQDEPFIAPDDEVLTMQEVGALDAGYGVSMVNAFCKGVIHDGAGGVLVGAGNAVAWATHIHDNAILNSGNATRQYVLASPSFGINPTYRDAPLIQACQWGGLLAFYAVFIVTVWRIVVVWRNRKARRQARLDGANEQFNPQDR